MTAEAFFKNFPKLLLASGLLFWTAQASHAAKNKPAGYSLAPAGVRQENPFPADIPVVPGVIVARMRGGVPTHSRGGISGTASLKKISAIEARPFFNRRSVNPGPLDEILKIRLAPGTDVFAAAAEMAASPDVLWAEPLYMHRIFHTPDDPRVNSQWYLDQVRAFAAWDEFLKKFTQGRNPDVLIAVVDNGVYLSHPDLAAVMWSNAGERPADGLDNDGNGYVDDVNGWDFADDDNNVNPDPVSSNQDKWHGSGVSGIAGASTGNGLGVAGLAMNARIMAVKVATYEEPGVVPAGLEGIVYAVDNGADIINCSWGNGYNSTLGREVIAHACSLGCLVVAAAGNEAVETDLYPAAYEGVLSVAALDDTDRKTGFSNWGYSVDVSAPGSDMFVIWGDTDTKYTEWDGTSFSTPVAAGIAALVKGIHPNWTGLQVGEQIRVSADDVDGRNPAFRGKIGTGRVNAYRAMTVALPSIRIDQAEVREAASGNGNGILDPGEGAEFYFHAVNYLESAGDILVSFSSPSPYLSIENPLYRIAHLNTLEEMANTNAPVRMQISMSAPRGLTVDVKAELSSAEGFQGEEHFEIEIAPLYGSLANDRVSLTVSSTGRLGYIDYPENLKGGGFVFEPAGNILFEGAFMAGTGPDRVSNVARGEDQEFQDDDFSPVPGGELIIRKPGALSDETGFSIFSDSSGFNPIGLKVTQTSHVFDDGDLRDCVLFSYELENPGTDPIQGLCAGLFLDWDIDDAGKNKPGYDAGQDLGFIYSPEASLFAGMTVFSGEYERSAASLKNPRDIYDGYTRAEKWSHLSGGVQPVTDMQADDYSYVYAAGPMDIEGGDTVRIGFAMLAGESLPEIRQTAAAAREKWDSWFGSGGGGSGVPGQFRLYPVAPNPFNLQTSIVYDLPQDVPVALSVYDILGRMKKMIVHENQKAGRHQRTWDGGSDAAGTLPSGLYVLVIQAGSFRDARKMVLIR